MNATSTDNSVYDAPPMTRDELKAYLKAQVEEIQKYKWIESERRQHDIGFHTAAMEWIMLYGESFRRGWDNRSNRMISNAR